MSSPVTITVLLIVIVMAISITIAWVRYRLISKREKIGTSKSSNGQNLHRSQSVFSLKHPQTKIVHFQIELAEGESVRVIVEGLPQGESPALVYESNRSEERDQANQTSEAEEIPVEAVSILEKEEIQAKAIPAIEDGAVSLGIVQTISGEKRSSAIKAVLFSVSILLAALPPILVFLDRWQRADLASATLGKVWNSSSFLRQMVYPPYFIYIFLAVIGVFILVWRVKRVGLDFVKPDRELDPGITQEKPGMKQRKISTILLSVGGVFIIAAFLTQIRLEQTLGGLFLIGMFLFFLGWALREVLLVGIWEVLKRNWKPAMAFIAVHVTLLLSLSSYYSDREWLWTWVILLAALLAFTLYKYRNRIPVVLWIMTLALILYTIRINGWEFSVIGDEYSFFMYAQELAKRHDLFYSINKLFNGVAVYGSHPFFSSFLQMISVKLFSGSNFGWRFSNLYLCALSLVFFYLFFRSFIKAGTALLAVGFLAVSHYIMTFGKIGYNNLQSYFILSLVLVAGAWAVRSKSTIAYVSLGVSMGACFYVYPAALYALPIAILLLLFYDAPFSRPGLKRWGAALISLGVLLIPLLLQKDYWSAKIPGTIFYTPDIMASAGSLASHFANNLIYAFLSFFYIPQESHFVVASYVDPLSGALLILGLAYLIIKGVKIRFVAFFLAGYAILLFFVGASHGGSFPPNTRMFMLLPWFAMLAAAGLEWLKVNVKIQANPRAWLLGGISVIMAGVLILNVYQAYGLSKQRSTGLQSPAMLFVRLLERIQSHKTANQGPLTIWFLTIPPWGIDGYRLFLTAYDIPDTMVRLEKVDVDGAQLPDTLAEKVRQSDAMVIIYPDIEPGLQEELGNTLAGLGKQPCPIKTVNDYTRFILWYSQPVQWVCEQGE